MAYYASKCQMSSGPYGSIFFSRRREIFANEYSTNFASEPTTKIAVCEWDITILELLCHTRRNHYLRECVVVNSVSCKLKDFLSNY